MEGKFTGGGVWGRDTSLTQEIRAKESLKPMQETVTKTFAGFTKAVAA